MIEDARAPFGRGLPGNRWNLLDGLTPDPLPSVTVIVVHYRQQAELDRTLAALARQTYPADLIEVVVVDDGSPELPRVPTGVVLVRQADEGFRAAAARNLGVRSSHGDVLCFLDADTAPEPEYVAHLTRLPALSPEAVTVGRRRHGELSRIPVDAPLESAGPALELPEPRWLIDAYRRSRDLLDADDRSYRHLIGAVLACSRWFFDRIGGFDENFRHYGGEDWEWAHRAWLAGAVLAHVPKAVAWHDGPEWSDRGETGPAADLARQGRKNAETLLLAELIGVAGSRGRALLAPVPDVVVRLHVAETTSRAAVFVCVDSVLTALPQATVVVPAAFADLASSDGRVVSDAVADADTDADSVADADTVAGTGRRDARVVIDIAQPVRVGDSPAPPGGLDLASAVATVGTGTLGAVLFRAPDGSATVSVTSSRSAARRLHWATDEYFDARSETAPWLTSLDAEPDLEAYLGGWG